MRYDLVIICLLCTVGCGYTERPVLDGVLVGEDGRILAATPHNLATETARRLDVKLQRLIDGDAHITSTVSGTPIYDPDADPTQQWHWTQARVTLRIANADTLTPGTVGSLTTAAENYMQPHMVREGILRVRVLTTDADTPKP